MTKIIYSIANPIRLQRSRQHKQVSPNGLPIVYVGRPSKWGNPFKSYELIFNPKKEIYSLTIPYSITDCVELYKRYMERGMKADEETWMKKSITELKGKNLSCWCKIGEPCHADILLEIANKIKY